MEAAFPFTKFVPPQLDDRIVVGPVVERLHAAVEDHPLTVVAAPAGSGKTTAMAAWVAESDGPVAWVRAGPEDDAAPATAAALLAGVRRAVEGFGDRLEAVLGAPETAAIPHHLVTSITNDLGEIDRLTIVLDDLHELTDPGCLELLDAVIDHLPSEVRVVVGSRTEPALSLPRRRVRGEVGELGLDDLRLDADAVRAVLAHEVTDDDVVEAVVRASGGWAAAVRLTTAQLRARVAGAASGAADPVASIRPDLWRFLAEEVLDAQPPDLRAFLLETSILDELTPVVCATVTGRSDAGAVLDELDRRNLFLARFAGDTGPAWRYHDLFVAFLRSRLAVERGDEAVADLHRRAAGALPATRAVGHLLAAGEHDRVAEIAVSTALGDLDASVLSLVAPWVEALPPSVIERHPRLAVLLAWRDEIQGRAEPILARLEPLHARLKAAGEDLAAAEVGLEIATAHLMKGELELAGQLLDEALDQPLDDWWHVVGLAIRMHWCRESGDWAGASDALEAVFDRTLGADDLSAANVVASALSLTLLFVDQGPAWTLARTERLIARLAVPRDAFRLVDVRPLLAAAAWLRLDLVVAADEVSRCLAASREVGMLAWTHQEAETLQLALSLAAGDHTTVRSVVEASFARMDGSPIDRSVRHVYAHAALRSAWLRGDRHGIDATIGRLAGSERPEDAIVREVAQALAVRLEGRGDDGVTERLREAENAHRELRLWIGAGLPGLELASFLLEQGRTKEALEAAEPTLATAADLGAGILLPEASSHAPLLERCVEFGLHPEMIRSVLSVLDRPTGPKAVPVPGTNETLSPRELEVLTHVARGRSNREIAEELYISEVTVKSHLTRVFRKLDATSRTHAVARARELHVL